MGMSFGSKVDNIGMDKPPRGTERAEKLMSPHAVERPDTQKSSGDNTKQWIGKSGKPSGPFGQQGRI
jgi:hypothetical protein